MNSMKLRKIFLIFFLLPISTWAAPIISQTGNLLVNGSLDSGSFDPITGYPKGSAASNWNQWMNSGTTISSELITEAEMATQFNTGLQDGQAAVKVKTGGAGDGLYCFSGGHPSWAALPANSAFTFSGWVYVISGRMMFSLASSGSNYANDLSTKTGQWEFISISIAANVISMNQLLIYAYGGAAEFIVDSIWLNQGTTSLHPMQLDQSTLPECSSIWLLLLGLLGLRHRKP